MIMVNWVRKQNSYIKDLKKHGVLFSFASGRLHSALTPISGRTKDILAINLIRWFM